MTCSTCGSENRAGRRFCSQCGAALSVGCPQCGAAAEVGDKFCGDCGSAVSTAASTAPRASPRAPESERRLVSVLFADLVGFTTLSESRDPEEVRELLSHYFDAAREIVERYGGVVEKFIGDAVMAVWGTPVAHEDDAERAVRAALDLVSEIATQGRQIGASNLRLRAGVLSGEAAVTIGASGQGMVAGDLVNTAARLQSAAAPGTVLVGESTYLASKAALNFESAGAHTLKGKELPVASWRALGVVAGRGGARRSDMLEPPFVGRDEDLRLLKDLLHQTDRESRPRLISVTGMGGIGKSRLAWEFFKYVDGVAGDIYWHQGRCPAYGEGVAFWALGEMVRRRAGILESEDPSSSRAKLVAATEEYVADESERRWIQPALAHLLGLESSPPGEREELFAAWRTFFEHVSERGPTVLVFEDLQWADPGLVDFIEHCVEWARNRPLLIVTLARPELIERRPTWGAGQRSFTSVHLEPLTDEVMRKLLAGAAEGLPDFLLDQIVERAEGVPLYAVEMLRMLIDRGHLVSEAGTYRLAGVPDRLEVPGTLHSLIASRLDGLAENERSLLQDASVLGKTFTLAALAALVNEPPEAIGGRLKLLVRKELLTIEADPRSPERGQFGFVQALIREVAYQTLSRRERQRRHEAAARHFESLDDEELAGVVATHYLEAHRVVPQGAEEISEKARAWLVRAADRAASLGAHRQALTHVIDALSVAGEDGSEVELWERAAQSAQRAGEFDAAESYLDLMMAWGQQRGDTVTVARAKALLGDVFLGRGQTDSAVSMLREAIGAMPDLGSDPAVVRLAERLARAHMLRSENAEAISWAERALVAAERLELVDLIAGALITKSVSLHDSGRWREAVVLLVGVIELCREHGLLPEQVRAHVNTSYLLAAVDPSRALAAAQEGLELARRLGLREYEATCAANGAEVAQATGDWDWANVALEVAYDEELPSVDRVLILANMVGLLAFKGARAAAAERLSETKGLVESMTSPQERATALWAESQAALAEGRLADARRAGDDSAAADQLSALDAAAVAARAALWEGDRDGAAELLDRHRFQRSTPMEKCHRVTIEAGIAALQGDLDEARSLYRRAFDGWRALGASFSLALAQLDLVLLLGSDDPEATEAASEARATFERLGAAPFLERLESAPRLNDQSGSPPRLP